LDPDAKPDDALERLVNVSRAVGGRPILVPTDDPAAYFLDDHAKALSGLFRFPHRPQGLARQLADKREMYALCSEFGVPTPDTSFPESAETAVDIAEAMSFPVVLKGIDTTALGQRTGVRMLIVRTPEELSSAYEALAASGESGLMVQSYIPGPPQSVWMFNGYFDAESKCRFGGCGRKLRQSPPYTGPTSLGVCTTNDTVYDTTLRLMDGVGYSGILDIGYRYDERDGQYKLLDVNPRLGATFRLWVAPNGLDVVRALYLDLTGQPLSDDTCSDGRKWLLETSDAASSWTYRRDGLLSIRGWLGSLRGVEEAGWFARDDPWPAAQEYTAAVRKLIRAGLGGGPPPAGQQ